MTTPTGTISLLDIQNEFGGGDSISLSEYYSGGGYTPPNAYGYIPLTSTQGIISAIPASDQISMSEFRGAPYRVAAGSETFTSSGTFVGKYGYSYVTLSWFDNLGYRTTTLSQTPTTSYSVTIGAAGAGSTFGSVDTGSFDMAVFQVYGNVDGGFYPKTNIYNSNGISSGFSYSGLTPYNYGQNVWNGETFTNTVSGSAAYTDKNGTYQPALRGLSAYFSSRFGMYFTSDSETGHGELAHSVMIRTFPSAAALNGTTYISNNEGRNNYYTIIDSWNPSTGELRFRNLDDGNSEGFYNTVINYKQPVWITATWS